MSVQMQRPEDKPKRIGFKLWRLRVSVTYPWTGWGFKREGWHFFHIRLGYALLIVKWKLTNKQSRRYMDKVRAEPINFRQAS